MKAKLERVRLLHVEMEAGARLQEVGRLAWQRGRIYFEYAPSFLALGRSISPLRLPLEPRTFMGDPEPFDGCTACSTTACPTAGAGSSSIEA